MRICAVQNQIQLKTIAKKVSKRNETMPKPQEQSVAPAFKGSGDGMLLGVGAGLTAGLIVIAGGAITGGLALPGLVANAGVIASALGGGYVGDKVEDKIHEFFKGDKKNKDK